MYVSRRVKQARDEQTQSPGVEEHHFLSHLSSLAARLFLRPGEYHLGRSRRPLSTLWSQGILEEYGVPTISGRQWRLPQPHCSTTIHSNT